MLDACRTVYPEPPSLEPPSRSFSLHQTFCVPLFDARRTRRLQLALSQYERTHARKRKGALRVLVLSVLPVLLVLLVILVLLARRFLRVVASARVRSGHDTQTAFRALVHVLYDRDARDFL